MAFNESSPYGMRNKPVPMPNENDMKDMRIESLRAQLAEKDKKIDGLLIEQMKIDAQYYKKELALRDEKIERKDQLLRECKPFMDHFSDCKTWSNSTLNCDCGFAEIRSRIEKEWEA